MTSTTVYCLVNLVYRELKTQKLIVKTASEFFHMRLNLTYSITSTTTANPKQREKKLSLRLKWAWPWVLPQNTTPPLRHYIIFATYKMDFKFYFVHKFRLFLRALIWEHNTYTLHYFGKGVNYDYTKYENCCCLPPWKTNTLCN